MDTQMTLNTLPTQLPSAWIKNINKLALYGTDSQFLLTANFKVTWHKNRDKIKKSGPNKLSELCPNVIIRGYLPAPIVVVGGDSRWKWPNFWFSRSHDLDLLCIGSHCMSSCITHRPLPTYQISLKSNKLFVDGRTDGHFSTQVIRSTRRSRPKNLLETKENDVSPYQHHQSLD